MRWFYVLIAGLIESTWPTLLGKYSDNHLFPIVLGIFIAMPTFYFLQLAVKGGLESYVVYFVFVGIGGIGNAVIATVIEWNNTRDINISRIAALLLVIAGVAWLKYIGDPKSR